MNIPGVLDAIEHERGVAWTPEFREMLLAGMRERSGFDAHHEFLSREITRFEAAT